MLSSISFGKQEPIVVFVGVQPLNSFLIVAEKSQNFQIYFHKNPKK